MKIIAVKLFQLKQLKRRNLNKFRLERFFQLLIKLKQLHCDDLHIILSLSAVEIYDYFIYSYSKYNFFRKENLVEMLKAVGQNHLHSRSIYPVPGPETP